MMAPAAIGTLRALLRWVIPSVVVAEAGLLAVRNWVPPSALAATNDVVGNYLQTLGTIYAVLLAFVVFVVWTQFNDARTCIEREANDLIDLYRTAKGLPDPLRSDVQRHVADYVDAVLVREWPVMAKGGDPGVSDGVGRILDGMWDALHVFEAVTHCHAALHADMLSRFNELSDARANRLTASRVKIPLALRFLVYMGAVVTVSSMYLFAVDNLTVHALITGAMAAGLSHVLYVIHDLDSCFDGDWQVPRSAFERVREYVRAQGVVAQ